MAANNKAAIVMDHSYRDRPATLCEADVRCYENGTMSKSGVYRFPLRGDDRNAGGAPIAQDILYEHGYERFVFDDQDMRHRHHSNDDVP